MAQPQAGVAQLSQKNGLSAIYQIKDIPMHAMSIAHLGAMIPGLVAEIEGENSSPGRVDYIVGFGSLLGSFIWQGNQPSGFNRLHSLEREEVFQPNTAGDLWIFLASQSVEINNKLEKCVQSYLSKLIIKKELIEGKIGKPRTPEPIDQILIGSSDAEFNQSCFVWMRGMEDIRESENFSTEIDVSTKERPLLNLTGVNSYRMYYELGRKTCFLEFFFAAVPELFKKISQNKEILPKQNFRPIFNKFFFLPSLEVLVSSRMGTLRMGSLSPTAKWKEY